MKKLILIATLFIFPILSNAQSCVKIDTVYSTAKVRELGNRNICFGIKQIAEEELSNKFCLSPSGKSIKIEVFYFGIPKKSLRIAGFEKDDQITQVGIKFYYDGKVIMGIGESETEVRATMIELTDGSIPFSKTTVSSAIKKAIIECISKM
jgi:hypothetical protein